MNKEIQVATSFNDKYYRYAYVMILSILENLDSEETIRFHLLYHDVTPEHQNCITDMIASYHQSVEWIYIDKNRFPSQCPTSGTWSLEMYFRLLLPDILPEEITRIIYLDVDIIVNKTLGEFYRIDMEGNCICACEDIFQPPFGDIRDNLFAEFGEKLQYICSGVMLIDMNLMRKTCHFADYMMQAEKWEFTMRAPDQDLINYMHQGRIKIVPSDLYEVYGWHFYVSGWHYEDVKKHSAIIHYMGEKPWEGCNINYDIEKLWWDYAKKTPFYQEFLEEFMLSAEDSSGVFETIKGMTDDNKKMMEENKRLLALLQKSKTMLNRLLSIEEVRRIIEDGM